MIYNNNCNFCQVLFKSNLWYFWVYLIWSIYVGRPAYSLIKKNSTLTTVNVLYYFYTTHTYMAWSRSWGRSIPFQGNFPKWLEAQAVSPTIYRLELQRGQARIQPAVISRNFPKWCTDICVIISFKSCLLIHIFCLSKK